MALLTLGTLGLGFINIYFPDGSTFDCATYICKVIEKLKEIDDLTLKIEDIKFKKRDKVKD